MGVPIGHVSDSLDNVTSQLSQHLPHHSRDAHEDPRCLRTDSQTSPAESPYPNSPAARPEPRPRWSGSTPLPGPTPSAPCCPACTAPAGPACWPATAPTPTRRPCWPRRTRRCTTCPRRRSPRPWPPSPSRAPRGHLLGRPHRPERRARGLRGQVRPRLRPLPRRRPRGRDPRPRPGEHPVTIGERSGGRAHGHERPTPPPGQGTPEQRPQGRGTVTKCGSAAWARPDPPRRTRQMTAKHPSR